MCGRAYSTVTQEEIELRYWNRTPIGNRLGITPNYNLAPTQLSPIIRMAEGKKHLELAKWGFIPFKPRGDAKPFAPINAKAETISEKPFFREAFKTRRCIVPVSGFFEWKKVGKAKHPFAVHLKDEKIMSLAGIYSTLTLDTGEILETFCILTTEANKLMAAIHDRMPVILDRDSEETWLDPKVQDASKLSALFKPFPAQKMEAVEVTTLVNSPKNNSPAVLTPVSG